MAHPRPISTRFPAALLRAIDADVLQDPNTSDRTAWIVDACEQKLYGPQPADDGTPRIDHDNPPSTREIEVRFRPAGSRWRWWIEDPELAGVSTFKRDVREDAGWHVVDRLGRGVRFTLKLTRDDA